MSDYKIPDQGANRFKPKTKPLQFKRGRADAFRKVNPILLNGEPAWEWDTCKLKIGDGKRRYKALPYVTAGEDGKSAYQLWLDAGNSGTVEDFLESLIGDPGKSAYEIWLSVGHEGTVVDFLNDIQGGEGKSAYDIWIEEGHEGSREEFLESLKGKSAYEIWLDLGHEGTVEEYMQYLCTMSWTEI